MQQVFFCCCVEFKITYNKYHKDSMSKQKKAAKKNSSKENTAQTKVIDSIVAGLFYGKVPKDLEFPHPCFNSEQKETGKAMLDAIGKFFKDNIDSAKLDEAGKIPEGIIEKLGELGLCGLAVPSLYEGMELDYSLYCRIFSDIAGHDSSIATTLGAHQSIGYRALLQEGNEEQKKKWLAKLATGKAIAAFCLTEPGSGSDAYSISTKAVKNPDETYTINGQKIWITNGGLADFYTVFCKTEHDIDGEKKEKISCFIVEKDREGMSFGERENKMGIKASETRGVFFDNVKIPAENMIGRPGKGFKIAMNVLNSGRLSLGAGTIGVMRKIVDLATNQAKIRKQFGRPIIEFGLIQQKLAYMAASCYATESVVFMTTGKMNQGQTDYSLETAICKVYGSEALWMVVDEGLQIAGGSGYMKEYPYERLMRDSRIYPIFEGTNEVLRMFIALSGMGGPSYQLKELGKISDVSAALLAPIKSLGVLSKFATDRLAKMIGSSTCSKIDPAFSEYSSKYSNMLGAFAIQVEDALIKYGKKIVDNELPLQRIANMAIELYVSLATFLRTSAILKDKNISKEKKEYVTQLTHIIWRSSRYNFMGNYKSMGKNNDDIIVKTVNMIDKNGGYGLDILDY